MHWALELADWLLTLLHATWILAFLTLWLSPRLRRIHLFLLFLTALSWFGFGYFWGWGYCVVTDLQWRVKEALGQSDLPGSFIQYLARRAGLHADDRIVDRIAGISFAVVATLSVVLNVRDWRAPGRSPRP